MLNKSTLKNIALISYIFTLYIVGVILISLEFWHWNILGIIFIVHSLIISANATHEFIHGNIFKNKKLNAFWGQAMTHLNGACYAPWEELVEHHFRHHLHHADYVGFDIIKYLKHDMHPFFRGVYVVLEWLYFPALEFEMRWRIILGPWLDSNKSSLWPRSVICAIYRTIIFGCLALVSWKAVLLYFFAYISFVNIIRFTDAFHHTYEYVVVGDSFPKRDRLYEQSNTFSNLISVKYPWLNLLFLNFGYHNAHHHNMSCPWHELPALHHHLYSNGQGGGLLPLPQLISNYHKFRVDRLFAGQGAMAEESTLDQFMGGVAVSLLTPP